MVRWRRWKKTKREYWMSPAAGVRRRMHNESEGVAAMIHMGLLWSIGGALMILLLLAGLALLACVIWEGWE